MIEKTTVFLVSFLLIFANVFPSSNVWADAPIGTDNTTQPAIPTTSTTGNSTTTPSQSAGVQNPAEAGPLSQAVAAVTPPNVRLTDRPTPAAVWVTGSNAPWYVDETITRPDSNVVVVATFKLSVVRGVTDPSMGSFFGTRALVLQDVKVGGQSLVQTYNQIAKAADADALKQALDQYKSMLSAIDQMIAGLSHLVRDPEDYGLHQLQNLLSRETFNDTGFTTTVYHNFRGNMWFAEQADNTNSVDRSGALKVYNQLNWAGTWDPITGLPRGSVKIHDERDGSALFGVLIGEIEPLKKRLTTLANEAISAVTAEINQLKNALTQTQAQIDKTIGDLRAAMDPRVSTLTDLVNNRLTQLQNLTGLSQDTKTKIAAFISDQKNYLAGLGAQIQKFLDDTRASIKIAKNLDPKQRTVAQIESLISYLTQTFLPALQDYLQKVSGVPDIQSLIALQGKIPVRKDPVVASVSPVDPEPQLNKAISEGVNLANRAIGENFYAAKLAQAVPPKFDGSGRPLVIKLEDGSILEISKYSTDLFWMAPEVIVTDPTGTQRVYRNMTINPYNRPVLNNPYDPAKLPAGNVALGSYIDPSGNKRPAYGILESIRKAPGSLVVSPRGTVYQIDLEGADPAKLTAILDLFLDEISSNWGGRREKWIRGGKDSAGKDIWYYLLPSGAMYKYGGPQVGKAGMVVQDEQVGMLDPVVYENFVDSFVIKDPARLKQVLSLSFDGKEYYNSEGAKEKWFRGTFRGKACWFFILPNGDVHRWPPGSTRATMLAGTSPLVGRLGAGAYDLKTWLI